MAESGDKVYQELIRQPPEDPVIVVGHNGPKGLGDRRHDPCGKDFRPTEGWALCPALYLHTYQPVRLGTCFVPWNEYGIHSESCDIRRLLVSQLRSALL